VFRKRPYTSGIAFALIFYTVMGGITLTLTVLLQLGLGHTPLRTSLTMMPWGLGAFVGAGLSRAMMTKLSRGVLHIGLVVMGTGLAAVGIVLRLAGSGVSDWDLAVPLLVCGIGMSMIFTPLFNIIMGCLAPHEMGSGSGVLQAVRGLGISVGIAGLGTLYFGLADAPAGQDPQAATDPARYAMGFVGVADETLLVAIGLIALAFLLGFLLPRSARAPQPAETTAIVARRDPSGSAIAKPADPAERVAEAPEADKADKTVPDPLSVRTERAGEVPETGEAASDPPSAQAEESAEAPEAAETLEASPAGV
jgi:MFS family permease